MKRGKLIAVCINRHVMIMVLWSIYDVDGHYFIFAAQILANLVMHMTSWLLHYIPQLYFMQPFNFI